MPGGCMVTNIKNSSERGREVGNVPVLSPSSQYFVVEIPYFFYEKSG